MTTYDPTAFVIVYSVTDRGSFGTAEEILKYLHEESCTKEKAVILVGNKVDLARSRIIKCEGLHLFVLLLLQNTLLQRK